VSDLTAQPPPSLPSQRPLRLCIALPGLHRVNRGAEVVLEEIARRAAADHGFDVTVFGSGPPRDNQPYTYHQLRTLHRETFEHFPRVPYLRDHYAYEEACFAVSLFRHYDPRAFDVTLTCGYPYTNWVLRRGRKRTPGRPAHVFVTQNGDWMVQAKNWEYKHFNCDALICTNPIYYARHKHNYRATLIPNGVDTDRFHPAAAGHPTRERFGLPQDAPVLLMVGALNPGKHVLEGLRAAARIPELHLVVAGDGEQRDRVDALGHDLLGQRFTRLTVPHDQMPHLYRAASALLHMSQDEPFGNIYTEALATGLPVIAHDTPATRWILEDQATLTDTTNQPALIEAITRSLPPSPATAATTRRSLAERRFSWPTIAAAYCTFLRQITGNP